MKIHFIFSAQYESVLGGQLQAIEAEKAINELSWLWLKNERQLKNALRNITGLTFKDKELECYVNSQTSISNPLSVRMEKAEDMFDRLIHELIQVLFMQNHERFKDNWDIQWKNRGKLPFLVKAHIPLHAVHLQLAQELFPDRVKRLKTYPTSPEYKASWHIVTSEGAENITKALFGEKSAAHN